MGREKAVPKIFKLSCIRLVELLKILLSSTISDVRDEIVLEDMGDLSTIKMPGGDTALFVVNIQLVEPWRALQLPPTSYATRQP